MDRSIIFADLSGFSALTEAHGDVDAVGIASRFKSLAEKAAADQARVVKTMGDAVMIAAAHPLDGARVAVDLADSVNCETNFPMVRIGLHHGPVVESDNDCFGATVNLAARVAGHARAGQILCTSSIADLVKNQSHLDLRDAGIVLFKNIALPVALFELCITDARSDVIIDPVCRMRLADVNVTSRIFYEGTPYYFCSTQCVGVFLESPGRYIGGH